MLSTQQTAAFRRKLLHWYCHHGRDLPWRRIRDPYAILVSEVMLQQTQVATVLPYYDSWLKLFPTFDALAAAAENDVLRAWQGLGYYTRAQNLHAAAKFVVEKHRGTLPSVLEDIQALPGVGRYTANAIATFAFDQSVPIVEANITRVIARLFNLRCAVDSAAGREQLWERAAVLVPKTKPGRFNSALMDLGALVCVSGAPRCGICPAQTFCRATQPELLPIKQPRPRVKRLIESHALSIHQKRILLEQCSRRWRGMWMLPRLRPNGPTERPVHQSVFPFTNHRITLRVFRKRPGRVRNTSHRWIPINELNTIPIPSPHRRAIVRCLSLSAGRLPVRLGPLSVGRFPKSIPVS